MIEWLEVTSKEVENVHLSSHPSTKQVCPITGEDLHLPTGSLLGLLSPYTLLGHLHLFCVPQP